MSPPELILFDDDAARQWSPFALTRPIGELLLGTLLLRERAERACGARCTAHLSAAHLRGFEEPGAPPVRSPDQIPTGRDRLFLSSRAVLDWRPVPVDLRGAAAGPVRMGDHVAGWWAPAGTTNPTAEWLLHPRSEAAEAGSIVEGLLLDHVWELVSQNPAQITADVAARFPAAPEPELPAGVHRIGGGALILGEGVDLEPGVVFDTSGGPVWLDRGASVRAFTRLAGPAYVGRGSTVLGGSLEAVSIGPVCKVRGELAESVCLGYVNKAHDGHIGHAYLGRWVNLGAETTNSDLKNNYGTIRLATPRGETDTGLIKMGCLLGDHVKTGIGLLLNTGTVVGAGSNLYGAAMPPRAVPPFSWGTGEELLPYRLDRFLEVAERAMGRRDVALSPGGRGQLEAAWKLARG